MFLGTFQFNLQANDTIKDTWKSRYNLRTLLSNEIEISWKGFFLCMFYMPMFKNFWKKCVYYLLLSSIFFLSGLHFLKTLVQLVRSRCGVFLSIRSGQVGTYRQCYAKKNNVLYMMDDHYILKRNCKTLFAFEVLRPNSLLLSTGSCVNVVNYEQKPGQKCGTIKSTLIRGKVLRNDHFTVNRL